VNNKTDVESSKSNFLSTSLISPPVMESRDASRDPFFEVSVSKVSGLVSVSVSSSCLETLHRFIFYEVLQGVPLKNGFKK